MTDAQLWTAWQIWLAVAAVVVALAAALLIAVIVTARGIAREAARARAAAESIRVNTLPIWALQTSNDVAGQLLSTVESIEAHGGALAAALTRQA
jgi:hypothetical protein